MSPRAAWRLEAMGFAEVYDFVDGKVAWIAAGLPTEGRGPHYAVAGEVATRDGLLICHLGDDSADLAERLEGQTFCVVVNSRGIVLGRVRKKDLGSGGPVEEIMEPGPATVRPIEPAKALLERMSKRNVAAILVTSDKGELIGLARREDLERVREFPAR